MFLHVLTQIRKQHLPLLVKKHYFLLSFWKEHFCKYVYLPKTKFVIWEVTYVTRPKKIVYISECFSLTSR